MKSSMKALRLRASVQLSGAGSTGPGDAWVADERWIDKIHDALYASKIISYAQGLDLMRSMGARKGWGLDLGAIASIWRGGCIIRARFLNHIAQAWVQGSADPPGLMLVPYFRDALATAQGAWRGVVAAAVEAGVPLPAMGAALAHYDACRSARLPANLLQAQRDFFGAHTYERVDQPAGQMFHTHWPPTVG